MSKPLYIDHSQPKDQLQGSSNQSPKAPTQDGGPVENSSEASKSRNDQQKTTFEGREGSGKPMAQQGQQRQQQGNNATKEAKPASSDKSGKNDSRQGQQAQKGGGETAKGNERPAPANSNSSNKDVKDPDSRNATSGRSGAIPI